MPDNNETMAEFLNKLQQTAGHELAKSEYGPPMQVPQYKTGDVGGGWVLESQPAGKIRGYFSGIVRSPVNVSLRHNGTVYMSLTPMEMESQWIPFAEAQGNVVVAGLGMAVVTLNMMHEDRPESIVVLERDRALIDALPDFLSGYSRQLWDIWVAEGRLNIVECDCAGKIDVQEIREFLGGDVDYLYADIWPTLMHPDAIKDTRNLCNQLDPEQAYFWGQELEFANVICQLRTEQGDAYDAVQEVKDAVRAMNLPLSIRHYDDRQLAAYAELIHYAAYNVSNY